MDTSKEFIVAMGTVVFFIAAMCITAAYCDNNKLECRQHAIQQGLTASDVQAICK